MLRRAVFIESGATSVSNGRFAARRVTVTCGSPRPQTGYDQRLLSGSTVVRQ